MMEMLQVVVVALVKPPLMVVQVGVVLVGVIALLVVSQPWAPLLTPGTSCSAVMVR